MSGKESTAGHEKRIRLLLAAKNHWMDRAVKAEAVVEAASELLTLYPADIFTGASGDEGPTRVVKLRAAVTAYDRLTGSSS